MYIIVLTNMTQANKAQSYLNKMRIGNRIERIKLANSGCGYGLRVYENPHDICQILSSINISYKHILNQ